MVKTYPAVTFIATYGRRVAVGAGVGVALIALAIFFALSAAPILLVAGLIAAGVIWAVLRFVAELVEVIADTLLPR